jgi:hypothetical protein
VSTIDCVLGGGQIVICDDGTRWSAVARDDAEMIEDWGAGALIAVHRQLLYRIDPFQAAEVELLRL